MKNELPQIPWVYYDAKKTRHPYDLNFIVPLNVKSQINFAHQMLYIS